MELRIQAARTTRDIDLAIRPLPGGGNQWDERAICGLLERAADIDLQDGFAFTIARAYLRAADPLAMTRTWEYVMAEKVKTVAGATRDRWLVSVMATPSGRG